MNEVLAKRMKRRRLKSRIKNVATTVTVLALLGSASFFAFSKSSFAIVKLDTSDKVYVDLMNVDKESLIIMAATPDEIEEKMQSENAKNSEEAKEGLDDEDNEADAFDTLTIRNIDYLTDVTLDGFEMKTKNLKIVTEKGVAIDSSETQYIFYYCIFNEVETLDLSEARFLNGEFTPHIFVASSFMKKVILPDDIKLIGKYAFYGWDSLEEINLPEELIEIEDGAFSGCSNLKPVEFGPVIEKIGEQAFLGCKKFVNVKLPDTINFIGRFCFADCDNLEELTLPNNDTLEISGLIMNQRNTVISVYAGTAAYKQMVPLSDTGASYSSKNKVLIKPVVTRDNLKKTPKIKEIKNTMNVGFDLNIKDFFEVDITGTGAISYKIELKDDIKLKDLEEGMNTVNYTVSYYLSDIDVSEIKTAVTKVDDEKDVINATINEDTDSRFFVLATMYKEDGKIKIKVENLKSELSKAVKEYTEKYSKFLKVTKHNAYMSGFKDGTFRPKDALTNGEVAAIISRIQNFDDTKEYNYTYSDVKKTSWLSKYVGYVTEKGIMTGKDNLFRPNESITRGEFVIAITKLLGLEPVDEESSFPDVWGKDGEEYIVAFEKLGIVKGLANGSFGYDKTITRAEAAKIINSALNRTIDSGKMCDSMKDSVSFTDVQEFNWFYADVMEATTTHYAHEVHK